MDSSLGTSWESGGRKSAALILFPMGVSLFPLLVKSFCRLPKPVRFVGVSQSPVFYEKDGHTEYGYKAHARER